MRELHSRSRAVARTIALRVAVEELHSCMKCCAIFCCVAGVAEVVILSELQCSTIDCTLMLLFEYGTT